MLQVSAGGARSFAPSLRKHLKRACDFLHCPLTELSIALVDDARMAQLHQRFMNFPGPTDVLTFPLERDVANRVIAGEVVICIPEARRRAKERGLEVRLEVLLYAIHGVLHLCGFDDKTDRGFRTMHAAEDDILNRLGLGAVFSAPIQKTPRKPAISRGHTSRAGRNGAV